MPRGPVPQVMEAVIAQMKEDHQITQIEVPYFQYTQQKLISLVDPDLTELDGRELSEIDEVIEKYGDRNAYRLTERSHGDMPWKATKNIGDVMHYDFAIYRDPIYSVTVGWDDDSD